MTDALDLDARGLSPPEPMDLALAALARLAPGQTLRLRIHREPFPLYELLEGMRYRHRTERLAEDDYLVLIWRHAS